VVHGGDPGCVLTRQVRVQLCYFFRFIDPSNTHPYTLSLPAALPIFPAAATITTHTGATASVWTLVAARDLVFATSTGAADTVFTIAGYDIYKAKMVETVTIASGDSSAAGKKAFKYVSSIAIYSAGNITTDTITVGTGEVLGLPHKLTGTGDFIQASLNGVFESTRPTVVKADATTVSATTGDVRGTIDLNSTLDGNEVVAYYHVTAPSTEAGIVGLTQYAG